VYPGELAFEGGEQTGISVPEFTLFALGEGQIAHGLRNEVYLSSDLA